LNRPPARSSGGKSRLCEGLARPAASGPRLESVPRARARRSTGRAGRGRTDVFSGQLSQLTPIPVVGVSYELGCSLDIAARGGATVRLEVNAVIGKRLTRNVKSSDSLNRLRIGRTKQKNVWRPRMRRCALGRPHTRQGAVRVLPPQPGRRASVGLLDNVQFAKLRASCVRGRRAAITLAERPCRRAPAAPFLRSTHRYESTREAAMAAFRPVPERFCPLLPNVGGQRNEVKRGTASTRLAAARLPHGGRIRNLRPLAVMRAKVYRKTMRATNVRPAICGVSLLTLLLLAVATFGLGTLLTLLRWP
jgi:hypothetical protein